MSEYRRKRTIQIGVRLSAGEWEALKKEGGRKGWTIAQVVRHRALKGLDVQAVPVGDEQRKAVEQ
jgi:hypothetical protein